MPLVELNPITRESMLAAQALWGLSDSEFGRAVVGTVEDPAKVVRAWKTGHSEPSPTARQAFHYLEAHVRIANNNPLCDAEENYRIAHGALPECLK